MFVYEPFDLCVYKNWHHEVFIIKHLERVT